MATIKDTDAPTIPVTLLRDDEKNGPETPRLSESEKAVNEMFANASAATDREHNMTLRQGIKLYPKAIAWSALISTLCAMEGYDISLIGNFCRFYSCLTQI
jgi:hypothetical protein